MSVPGTNPYGKWQLVYQLPEDDGKKADVGKQAEQQQPPAANAAVQRYWGMGRGAHTPASVQRFHGQQPPNPPVQAAPPKRVVVGRGHTPIQ